MDSNLGFIADLLDMMDYSHYLGVMSSNYTWGNYEGNTHDVYYVYVASSDITITFYFGNWVICDSFGNSEVCTDMSYTFKHTGLYSFRYIGRTV